MERDDLIKTALDAEFDCCWEKRSEIDIWDNKKDCAIYISDIGQFYKFFFQKVVAFNKEKGTITVETGYYFLDKETMEWEKDDNHTSDTKKIP